MSNYKPCIQSGSAINLINVSQFKVSLVGWWIKYNQGNKMTYILLPWFQKSNAKKSDEMKAKRILFRLYSGLLQYDKQCFLKHTVNWTREFTEKREAKWSFFKPGEGLLNCSTSSFVSLWTRLTLVTSGQRLQKCKITVLKSTMQQVPNSLIKWRFFIDLSKIYAKLVFNWCRSNF